MGDVLVPDATGQTLEATNIDEPLLLEGELNKLAANISIGRNLAGVHYYSDYYDSLRMGEEIAIEMLKEQMVTYPEPVTMRFTSFDGERVTISTTGDPTSVDVSMSQEPYLGS